MSGRTTRGNGWVVVGILANLLILTLAALLVIAGPIDLSPFTQ